MKRKMMLYYDVTGNQKSNQNLVFIHGSGCNRKFLRPLAVLLKQYRCYLIDLPEHGRSSEIRGKTVEDYIDAAAELVSGLENVTLIGHSLGGTVCLGVASKALPGVKRSVIISSAAKYHLFDQRIHQMVARNRPDWPYIFKCLGSLGNVRVLLSLLTLEKPAVLIKDFAIDIKLNIEDMVDNIHTPTLIMVGDSDILTVPEYSFWLKSSIRRSKLIVIPGFRHMLPLADRKHIAMLIRKFIGRT